MEQQEQGIQQYQPMPQPRSHDITQVMVPEVVSFEVLKQRREVVKQVVNELMVEGTHYGAFGGTSKKSLMLPGAELLMSTFGLHIDHEYVREDEDFEKRILRYRCRAFILMGPGVRGTSYEATAFNREKRFWCHGGQDGCPKNCPQNHEPSMHFGDQIDNVRRRAHSRAVKGLIRLVTGTTGYFDLMEEGDQPSRQPQRRGGGQRRPQQQTQQPPAEEKKKATLDDWRKKFARLKTAPAFLNARKALHSGRVDQEVFELLDSLAVDQGLRYSPESGDMGMYVPIPKEVETKQATL